MKKPLKILPETFKNFFSKKATSNYPFEKANLYSGFRGRILFESDKCIGCKMCMRVCPSNAIEIILSNQEEINKTEKDKTIMPKKFDCIMNLDHCIYCAQCVEICPKKALSSSPDFELAQLDKTKLKLHYK